MIILRMHTHTHTHTTTFMPSNGVTSTAPAKTSVVAVVDTEASEHKDDDVLAFDGLGTQPQVGGSYSVSLL